MVNSLNYIHCKFTLNLSSIEQQRLRFTAALTDISNALHPPHLRVSHYEPELAKIVQANYQQTQLVIALHRNDIDDVHVRLQSLRYILPTVPTSNHHIVSRDADLPHTTRSPLYQNPPVFKIAKFLRASFTHKARPLRALNPFGIFGTFMGIYNAHQIRQLQAQLNAQADAHNKLVEVVQQHDTEIEQLDSGVSSLITALGATVYHNPAFMSVQLSRLIRQLNHRLDIATHVIQQAQHRRLAVDLLPPEQLVSLYNKLAAQARQNGCNLLTSQPSDLFQIELSYFYDGSDVHLLLHVPMVPEDSLLRLFRLHPFPLPLSKTHSLIPTTDNNILAISSGFKRYHTQFSHTDLLGCNLINNVYLCQRMGSLNKNISSTCLGSLYQQQFEAVKQLCPLKVRKTEEVVHPLLNNWFLAYSTSAQTVPIECRNGTQAEVYLQEGMNKFFVSPGCKCTLSQHIITSDLNVRTDTDIVHYEWSWDKISLSSFNMEEIIPQLTLMEAAGLHRPTLSDLQSLKIEADRAPGWIAHYVYMTGMLIIALSLVAALSYALYYYYLYRRRNLAQVPPPPIVNAPQAPMQLHDIQPPHYHLHQ